MKESVRIFENVLLFAFLFYIAIFSEVTLSSTDVETTNPIHHLISGGGIVCDCAVLCVLDTYGHRWDTDQRRCLLCSEQQVHAVGADAPLHFYPAVLA